LVLQKGKIFPGQKKFRREYIMAVEDKITLSALKNLIKDHAKTLPKLSSGKQNLLLYAHNAGLLKKPDATPAVPIAGKEKRPIGEKKAAEPLPQVLQKTKKEVPVKKGAVPAVAAAPPVKTKREASGFAAFMAQNKGQGLSMSQLSQMYRESKNVE
jgi:hypothetical protein